MLSPRDECPGRPTTPSKPGQFHYICISAVHLKDQRTWAFIHASAQLFSATAASIKTEGFPFRRTLVGRLFHSVCANIDTRINVNKSRMFDFLSFSLMALLLFCSVFQACRWMWWSQLVSRRGTVHGWVCAGLFTTGKCVLSFMRPKPHFLPIFLLTSIHHRSSSILNVT